MSKLRGKRVRSLQGHVWELPASVAHTRGIRQLSLSQEGGLCSGVNLEASSNRWPVETVDPWGVCAE